MSGDFAHELRLAQLRPSPTATRPVVIAEVGSQSQRQRRNSRGAWWTWRSQAGAHVVKFQAFRSEKEISKFAAKAPYQQETTSSAGNQLEMCKALELSGSRAARAEGLLREHRHAVPVRRLRFRERRPAGGRAEGANR